MFSTETLRRSGMAKSNPSQPSGSDTPASNQPKEMAAPAAKPASNPPSEGKDPKTSPPRTEGAEAVAYHPRTVKALSETFAAPTTMLPDIGEASFGSPPKLAETVHGPDDRVQIANTSVYPWRAHA